jgi:hypothetical protein
MIILEKRGNYRVFLFLNTSVRTLTITYQCRLVKDSVSNLCQGFSTADRVTTSRDSG